MGTLKVEKLAVSHFQTANERLACREREAERYYSPGSD